MDAAIDWNSFKKLERQSALLAELRHALKNVQEHELKSWAKKIPLIAGEALLRRGSNLKETAKAVGAFSISELKKARDAWRLGSIATHCVGRAKDLALGTRDFAGTAYKIGLKYGTKVAANPRSEAPVLIAGVLGFMVSSGGPDGDGGIPDLDLLGGIGAHRSLLTHTIVAGVVAETLILSAVDLAGRIHSHLPEQHDQLWDSLRENRSREAEALRKGVSWGLRYHFLVDATVDAGGAYAATKGIISPLADNLFQAANAVAEGDDSIKRKRRAP